MTLPYRLRLYFPPRGGWQLQAFYRRDTIGGGVGSAKCILGYCFPSPVNGVKKWHFSNPFKARA